MQYRLSIQFLISETLIIVGKVDDATIGKAVLLDIVLHDPIVLMGIDTNVCIMRKAEVHDGAENTMDIRVTGNTMYDTIGL